MNAENIERARAFQFKNITKVKYLLKNGVSEKIAAKLVKQNRESQNGLRTNNLFYSEIDLGG